MVVGLPLPAGIWQGQQVLGDDTHLGIDDLQRIVQGNADSFDLTAQRVGDAVAVAADFDVASQATSR